MHKSSKAVVVMVIGSALICGSSAVAYLITQEQTTIAASPRTIVLARSEPQAPLGAFDHQVQQLRAIRPAAD